MKDWKGQFREGLLTNNPVLVQALGLCSTMAITTSLMNGLGMGLSVLLILLLSNVVVSALRRFVPESIRIAVFIVVIAAFVTCVDLLLQAFFPEVAESLGVFIPLIVVNCIVLGRAESYAYRHDVRSAAWDGICQGLGYTVVLILVSVIREFLGAGTFGGGLLADGKGLQILPVRFPAALMTQPLGGFLVLAGLIAAVQWAQNKTRKGE